MQTITKPSDFDLDEMISSLRSSIKEWALERDLWFDSGFASYLERVEGQPSSPPVVTMVFSNGELRNVFEEDPDCAFMEFLEGLGYWYENVNGYTIEIYPLSEELCAQFEEYFYWQWVCGLIKDDTADVYEEIYSHFIRNPDDLYRLEWRSFEILLHRIFQSHGYKSILGPGQNDGGIDIRLYQEDPIGDVLTVVQAKKYAPHRKIDLTDVAAIHGIRDVENADRALFVTTSSYLPSAQKFSERTNNKLELAEKSHVINWCVQSHRGIIEDKSTLLSIENVRKILIEASSGRDLRIVHSTWGYNMTHNSFALVVKESRHAALLMGLRNEILSDDGYGLIGTEVPNLNPSLVPALLISNNVWRAKRNVDNNSVSYWDGENLFSPWIGQPVSFNYMD